MHAIILAGGLGLRLRPLTADRPKPMVEVLGKPILQYQIEWLRKNKIRDIVIACGYRYEKIMEYFGNGENFDVRIKYSIEEKKLGTGGGIKQALKFVDDDDPDVIATNGDIILDIDIRPMIEFHKKSNFMATIMLVPFRSPYGIVEVDDATNAIRGFVEKPELPYWINGGVYIMNKEIIEVLPDAGDIENTAFPQLAKEGKLGGYKARGYWRAIDTVKDLNEAEKELRKMKESKG